MTASIVIRRTFTLTDVEIALLEKIARHRHPTDKRVESLTLRELIREEYERLERKQRQTQKAEKR